MTFSISQCLQRTRVALLHRSRILSLEIRQLFDAIAQNDMADNKVRVSGVNACETRANLIEILRAVFKSFRQ